MLTAEQRRLLTWIRDTPHHIAGWKVLDQKTGKIRDPKGKEGRDKWSHWELSGQAGSIVVTADVQKSCLPFFKANYGDGPMWVLTEAGNSALEMDDAP